MYMTKGVPQGLSSSPVLFDIYINSAIDELNKLETFNVLYADDIFFLSKDLKHLTKNL